ncbi:hypothetical protein HRUBRA_00610 [Pseudohaliea rubra DSM 19751]|uniref:Uncharacterized protein n=1 Tax=Pseudohaliea rubra DSM 19751 TaxID=1265313 RepID=A0A095VTE6_9GAMM|nr:hypothetical protein HRUBRA_00610 [Pseudohaliea rubra DSM 19751]
MLLSVSRGYRDVVFNDGLLFLLFPKTAGMAASDALTRRREAPVKASPERYRDA